MNLTWLYVGALYAIAVLLLRRAGTDLPRRVALGFYLLVLLFFFRPMTQAWINVPTDFIRQTPPWIHVHSGPVLNDAMNDVALQHAIWAHQVRESWKSFDAPLWNHLSGAGYPLLANGQSSALSPLRILALPLPLGQAMTAEAAMKILVGLTFTFLYCRRRNWSAIASATAGVAFGFGGFLTIWLHFPHTTAACFLPAVFYLIDLLVARFTVGRFVAAAAVWAAIVFGGHPETASHIFFLALIYVLWIIAVERRATWRLLLQLGGAMTVAALLASPFLLPFAEAVTRSQRYDWLRATPFSAKDLPFKNWQAAATFVQPHLWGRVPAEQNWAASTPEAMSGFAGTLGLAAWLATAIGVIRRRDWRSIEAFFALATLLVIGVIFAWPGIGEGIHLILPLVAHARFRLLFTFLAAVQSAIVIDRAIRGERWPLRIGLIAAASLVALLLIAIPFPTPDHLESSVLAAVPSLIVVAAGLALTFTRRHLIATAVLAAAVTLELFSIFRGWSPPLPAAELYPRTPLIEKLETLSRETSADRPFRIAGLEAQLFPNTSAIYGLEDIRAHDPMANARYLAFLGVTAGYDPWEYFARLRNIEPSVYDYLNVRYVITNPFGDPPDASRYRLVYQERDGWIYENLRALPRFFAVRNVIPHEDSEAFLRELAKHSDWANTALLDSLEVRDRQVLDDLFKPRPASSPLASASIREARPTDFRLTADAPRWSVIASSMPHWPGWKVAVNGSRVDPIRVNGAFLGFIVPPGESSIRVWYSPTTWWAGVWLSLLTCAVLIVVMVRGRTRPLAAER